MAEASGPSGGPSPLRPYRLDLFGWFRPGVAPWWALVAGGAVALALGIGLIELLQLMARPLGLLFLGMVIASAIAPAVHGLHRRLPWFLSVIIPYLFAILVLIAAVVVGYPPLVAQLEAALAQLPQVADALWAWVSQQGMQGVVEDERVIDSLLAQLDTAFGLAAVLPVVVVTTIIEVVTVLFISLYWLLALPKLAQFVLSLAPSARRPELEGLFMEMGQAMGGYVRGVFIDSVMIGAAAFIGFVALGVPYPLVLALLAGLMEAIPYIGPLVSGAVAVAVAFIVSPTLGLAVLVFWTVLQQFENNVLVPTVMRSQMAIPPLLVVFAIIAGFTVGGILGALVAVPLCGALRVFIVREVAPAVRRWTGAYTGEEAVEAAHEAA